MGNDTAMGRTPIRSTENLMKIGHEVPKIGPRRDRQICRRTDRHTDRQNTQIRSSQYSAPTAQGEKTKKIRSSQYSAPTAQGEKTKNCRNVFCAI